MQKIKNKKSQMKVQETAFVLLALVLLFSLAFIFYSRFKYSQLVEEANTIKNKEVIALLDKITRMSEFSCINEKTLCMDLDKLAVFENYKDDYKEFFKGIGEIKVIQIYPEKKTFLLHEGKADITDSTFISLCKQKQKESYVWYECSLGKILISREVLK